MIDGMTNVTVDDELSFQTNFLDDEGIVNHSGTDLQVQAQTVPDLTVKVKAGTCYVKRDAWTAASGTLKFWEAVLDADANVTIPANNSGGTIRRIVCMKIDTGVSPDANASNVASLVVVSGVSGGGDPTIPDNHLPLARVTHANSDTSIASGDITDLRTEATIKEPTPTYTAVSGASPSLDLNTSKSFALTLSANATLSVANVEVGDVFMIDVTQASSGGPYTLTHFSGITWMTSDGNAPTLPTTASKKITYGFKCVATDTYLGYLVGQNF